MGYTNLGTAVIYLINTIRSGDDGRMIILKSKRTGVYYVYWASDEQVNLNINELKTMDLVLHCSRAEAKSIYKALNGLQGELEFGGDIEENNKSGEVPGDNNTDVDAGPSEIGGGGSRESGVLSESEHISKAAESAGTGEERGEKEPVKRDVGEQTQE